MFFLDIIKISLNANAQFIWFWNVRQVLIKMTIFFYTTYVRRLTNLVTAIVRAALHSTGLFIVGLKAS